jgi:actin-like ATPase involved in cell morphogenesis
VGYQVGIDLGTTFTAAAVHRDGRSSIFSLGSQAASIPSVVLLREDGTELTGEAAVRRALTEPERVAREFKRRLGDTTPIIVGGSPYSAEQLMARLLKATLAEIEKREGGAPDRIAITHPANWGPYKIDLLNQAVRLTGLNADHVDLLTEPEAAAISYATQQRVEPGEVIAVYDLGGGTFDAAVLRRTTDGFEILGRPEGIERMGGIDFDAAVFAHVNRALDGKLQELDPEDPAVISGVARLREDCVNAKIALSSDTDATIPVLLPGIQADVRITRAEFEALIRPSLADSIGAMHRALETAGITAADVSKVLLVGGSSRIPLIGQLVSSELDRPVAVDADPKHAIALGAAAFAGGSLVSNGAGAAGAGGGTPAPAAAGGAVAGAAATGAAVGAAALPPIVPAPEPIVLPTEAVPAAAPPVAASGAASQPTRQQPAQQQHAVAAPPVAPSAPVAPSGSGGGPASSEKSKVPMIVGGVVAAAVIGVGAFIAFGSGGGDEETAATTIPEVTVAPEVTVDPAVTQPPNETVVENPDTTAVETVPDTTTPIETVAPPTDDELLALVSGAVGPIDANIAASVTGGVATLTGLVSAETASAAVSAVGAIDGITGVDRGAVECG